MKWSPVVIALLVMSNAATGVTLALRHRSVVRVVEYAKDTTCEVALVNAQAQHVTDSVRLRSQRKLAYLTFFEARRVAKIVARDPSQAHFLVGWTNRAFVGLPMDSVVRR